MSELNCYYPVKVDISSALRDDWRFPNDYNPNRIWMFNSNDIFNSDWLDYTTSIGLPIAHAMVFNRQPGSHRFTAHVDSENLNNALNWVYGGEESSMVWYDLPNDLGLSGITSAGTPFSQWPKNQLKYLTKTNINTSPTLVRVDIPHVVEMPVTGSERWCISVRLNLFLPTWEDTVNYYTSKNLL